MGLTGWETRILQTKNYFDSDDVGHLTASKQTPMFIVDLHVIRQQLAAFTQAMRGITPYYSTKTNPHPAVMQVMIDHGVGFDVATVQEMQLALRLGARPEQLLATHPVMSVTEAQEAYSLGVRNFTIDCLSELQRRAPYLPNARYFVRIAPKGNASMYDYRNKFGASDVAFHAIMAHALQHNIPIAGISFMVGSQSLTTKPWQDTLAYVIDLLLTYYERVPSLRTINIGSGFPLGYRFSNDVPTIQAVANVIHDATKSLPPDVQLIAEPGRYLVGPSTVLATQVIQRISRGSEEWLYTDATAYSGLIEIIESGNRFAYEITTRKHGPLRSFQISGKTLDPDDMIGTHVPLSNNVTTGDILYVRDTGAYSSSFFTDYHSLNHPELIVCDSQYAHNAGLGTNQGQIQGLQAKRHIQANQTVFMVSGYPSAVRTRTTFQIGAQQHVEPSLFGAYLNHSCNPNVGIRAPAQLPNQLEVIALRDIFPHEDIVVDYAMFEYETGPMAQIACRCGSHQCRTYITGYKDLPAPLRMHYQGYIADYLTRYTMHYQHTSHDLIVNSL